MSIRKIYIVFILTYSLLLLYWMFIGFGRETFSVNIVRLKPLVSSLEYYEQASLKNIFINFLGNIIVFIPFGFLGIAHQKFNSLKTLIIYFLSVIIIIEFLQYITRRGVFDIDDIFLNTLGVFIGFKFYKSLGI